MKVEEIQRRFSTERLFKQETGLSLRDLQRVAGDEVIVASPETWPVVFGSAWLTEAEIYLTLSADSLQNDHISIELKFAKDGTIIKNWKSRLLEVRELERTDSEAVERYNAIVTDLFSAAQITTTAEVVRVIVSPEPGSTPAEQIYLGVHMHDRGASKGPRRVAPERIYVELYVHDDSVEVLLGDHQMLPECWDRVLASTQSRLEEDRQLTVSGDEDEKIDLSAQALAKFSPVRLKVSDNGVLQLNEFSKTRVSDQTDKSDLLTALSDIADEAIRIVGGNHDERIRRSLEAIKSECDCGTEHANISSLAVRGSLVRRFATSHDNEFDAFSSSLLLAVADGCESVLTAFDYRFGYDRPSIVQEKRVADWIDESSETFQAAFSEVGAEEIDTDVARAVSDVLPNGPIVSHDHPEVVPGLFGEVYLVLKEAGAVAGGLSALFAAVTFIISKVPTELLYLLAI